MRRFFGTAFRFFVGSEYGMFAEGNQQWYYTVALAINNMLAWVYLPECALGFIILSTIHLISVYLYAWLDDSKKYAIMYLTTHLILLIVAFFFNWWWTLLSSLIMMAAYFVAPDCTGNNIFMRKPHTKETEVLVLFFNTALMAIFIGVVTSLPTVPLTKLVIITVAILSHPFIDWLSQEGIIIQDTIEMALEIILGDEIKIWAKKRFEK